MTEQPFWRAKPLAAMNDAEWESLCDGCGRCCLHKIEDIDTGDIALTNVACYLLDLEHCRCKDYANRQKFVLDCVRLTPKEVPKLKWLPETCAYRLVSEGKDLYWWHHLISGDPATVHKAGISVRRKAISEDEVDDIEDHIQRWLSDSPPDFGRS
jgi:uncharacterized cysteine cluster protein YcgN (CxxCxxCC family)